MGVMKTYKMPDDQMKETVYGQYRDRLLNYIEDMPRVNVAIDKLLEELKEKITTNAFNLVVLGQFKRGKTTFINALIGNDLLPVAAVPLTSVVTKISYGDELSISVNFLDGSRMFIGRESLADYVTEKGNPANTKNVADAHILYPAEFLRNGINIVDTPGVGSVYQHNTDVAYSYLPKADAALFILSADQPISRSELDFLLDIKKHANKIFFLLNKVDYVSEEELSDLIEFISRELRSVLGYDVRLFPISAKRALDGIGDKKPGFLSDGNMLVFMEELERFLMKEKGYLTLTSAAGNLQRIIAQSDLVVSLEMKALFEPLEKIRENLTIFETRKKEIEIEKQDFSALFNAEIKRIFDRLVEPEMAVFKKDIEGKLYEKLERVYQENRKLSLRELHALLEREIIEGVRHELDVLRQDIDERVSEAFAFAGRRYINKIKNLADDLMKLSSDLFSVSFSDAESDAVWNTQSNFYYKFRFEPVSLEMLTSSLTFSLPKFIGKSLIFKSMKNFLANMIDMQSGRIAYDFRQRLEKSRMDFEAEMKTKMDAISEGIEKAVQQGIRLRSQGKVAIEERANRLSLQKKALERMMADVTEMIINMNESLPRSDNND